MMRKAKSEADSDISQRIRLKHDYEPFHGSTFLSTSIKKREINFFI